MSLAKNGIGGFPETDWVIYAIVCSIHDSTWLDQMGEDQRSQNVDCYCREKAAENQLKTPFMVELDELCWLGNGSM